MLVTAEYLAQKTPGTAANHGATHLAAHHKPQSGVSSRSQFHAVRYQAASHHAGPPCADGFELARLVQAIAFWKAVARSHLTCSVSWLRCPHTGTCPCLLGSGALHGVRVVNGRHGSDRRAKPVSAAFDRHVCDWRGLPARSWWSCGCGNRVAAAAAPSMVGIDVSSRNSLPVCQPYHSSPPGPQAAAARGKNHHSGEIGCVKTARPTQILAQQEYASPFSRCKNGSTAIGRTSHGLGETAGA